MWQDGLALLIVAIAVLALLRTYTPVGRLRFDVHRSSDSSDASVAPTGGCGGCGSGASCAKAQIKDHSGALPRRK